MSERPPDVGTQAYELIDGESARQMLAGSADAWAFVREQSAASAERTDKLVEVGRRVDGQVIETRSPRGEVRVQVDGHGLIRDVVFSDAAPGASPLALARAVQQAHDAALRQLQENVIAIADEHLADDPHSAESLKNTYRTAIPQRVYDEEEDSAW